MSDETADEVKKIITNKYSNRKKSSTSTSSSNDQSHDLCLSNDSLARLMQTANEPGAKLCEAYLESHFKCIGDEIPNKDEIHIELCDKKEIYNEYVAFCLCKMGGDVHILSESRFLHIWKQQYERVKIRRYKAVTGKCHTCAILSELRKKEHRPKMQQGITHLHALHRITYMAERRIYYQKIVKAVLEPESYMSAIVDGMAENHTELPYLGNLKQSPKRLPMHLQGVLEHGEEFVRDITLLCYQC